MLTRWGAWPAHGPTSCGTSGSTSSCLESHIQHTHRTGEGVMNSSHSPEKPETLHAPFKRGAPSLLRMQYHELCVLVSPYLLPGPRA